MKKFAFLLLFLIGTSCFASENLEVQLERDYLITSNTNIKTINVDDSDIVNVSPFFTVFNEKNVWLLHPKGIGKTKFSVVLQDSSNTVFDVSVKPYNAKSIFKDYQKGEFEIMLLDKPPSPKKPNVKGVK